MNEKQIIMKKIVGISLVAALFIFSGCEKENRVPTCTINKPAEGEKIYKCSVYTIEASANDPDGNLASSNIYIDNNGVGPRYGFTSTYDWDMKEEWVGNHTISFVVIDSEGKRASAYRQVELYDSIPDADFIADKTVVAIDDTVWFTDLSFRCPTEWLWDFGDNTSAIDQNPYKIYNEVDTFSVSLIASNTAGSDTITKTNYISVIAK